MTEVSVIEVFEHKPHTQTGWNPYTDEMPFYLRSRDILPNPEGSSRLIGYMPQYKAETERSVVDSTLKVVSMADPSVNKLGIHSIVFPPDTGI